MKTLVIIVSVYIFWATALHPTDSEVEVGFFFLRLKSLAVEIYLFLGSENEKKHRLRLPDV